MMKRHSNADCIIEKSNQNLTELTAEYNRVKANRPSSYDLPARVKHPKAIKESRGMDKEIEGPHQKAALDAFKATITRPVIRFPEDDVTRRIETRTRHSVERAVDEKLTSVSRAIDALRDHVCAVADEVRELHNQASRTSKSLSSQERRIDDVDAKRRSIEAHFADEISSIKHLLAQSVEKGMSTTVSPTELKSAMETSELNAKMLITTSLAPLRNSFRTEISNALKEFALVKDSLECRVDEKIETIESKLLIYQTSNVKMQNNAVAKRCLEVLEGDIDCLAETLKRGFDEREAFHQKETIKMIKHIVSLSVAEIERDLTDRLTVKLEERQKDLRDQSTPKSNALTVTEEAVESLKKAIATMNNGLRNAKEQLNELEERISSIEECRKKSDSDISSIFDSLARHKTFIETKFVTRDELQNITAQLEEYAQQVSSINCEHESVLSDLSREWSSKFSSLEEKIRTIQSFDASIPDVAYLEQRIGEIETADFKGKLDKILDVVESLEQRVQVIENDNKVDGSPFKSTVSMNMNINKIELGKLLSEVEDRSKTQLAFLSPRIQALERQQSIRPFRVAVSNESDIFKEDKILLTKKAEDFCDSLGKAITNLHCTLSDAKELGGFNVKADSHASQNQAEMAEKDSNRNPVMPPTPNLTKPENMKYACVHLMGLSPPDSHDSSSTSIPPLSLAEKDLETTHLATNEFQGRVDIAKDLNDLEEETKTERSETGDSVTRNALSLCGVLTDDNIKGSVVAETKCPSPDLDAASNLTSDEIFLTRDNGSLSPELSKLSEVEIPMKELSEIFKMGRNLEPASYFHAHQSSHSTYNPSFYLQNDASDVSPISRCDIAPGKLDSPVQDDAVSIPGSLTSFDEVECVLDSVHDSKTRSSVSCNSTRIANPTPYEGWDRLLTELRASGRILKDSDDGNSATATKEKRVAVDNAIHHECSVSYDSSFESEGDF